LPVLNTVSCVARVVSLAFTQIVSRRRFGGGNETANEHQRRQKKQYGSCDSVSGRCAPSLFGINDAHLLPQSSLQLAVSNRLQPESPTNTTTVARRIGRASISKELHHNPECAPVLPTKSHHEPRV
jgi:hypothetical protein